MAALQEVALGEIATLTWRGEVPDPEESYRLVGVRWWGGGAYEYKRIQGADTQAPQLFRVEPGDLVINKIWARHGSIAVVDETLAGAYGSAEFPTFTLDANRVEPRFVHWFSKSKLAWAQCELLSQGTSGKNRVKPERFLTVRIPLPSLETQRTLCARLDSAGAAVSAREAKATHVASEIDATLRAAFARIIADAPRVAMGEIAPLVRRPVVIDPDASYPELGVRSFGKGLFTKPDLVGSELTWQSLFRIEAGDLVFSNIKAWEGAFAVAEREHDGKHGSHRYLTCVPDANRATAHFLWYYLQSEEGIYQVGKASAGSADRNRTLATKRLQAIKVPVPSLDAQLWFDSLQAKACAAKTAQAEATAHLDQLLPAMLNEVFG